MKITKISKGNTLTIQLDGKLDTTTAPLLSKELETTLPGVTNLVFDLTNLAYISSAGLRVFMSAYKTMNKQGSMAFCGVNEDVMEIFKITGFSEKNYNKIMNSYSDKQTNEQTIRYDESLEQLDEEIKSKQKIISNKQARLEQLEAEYKYYKDSFNEIENAFFWKITKPMRILLVILRYLKRHHIDSVVFHKAVSCLKTNGIKVTWLKLLNIIYNSNTTELVSKSELFTKAELEERK